MYVSCVIFKPSGTLRTVSNQYSCAECNASVTRLSRIARVVDDKWWNLPKIYCHLVRPLSETNCFKSGRQTNNNLKCCRKQTVTRPRNSNRGPEATFHGKIVVAGGWGGLGARGVEKGQGNVGLALLTRGSKHEVKPALAQNIETGAAGLQCEQNEIGPCSVQQQDWILIQQI